MPVDVTAEKNQPPVNGTALLKFVKLPVNAIGYVINAYVLAVIAPGLEALAGNVIVQPFVFAIDVPVGSWAANTDAPAATAKEVVPLVAV
jgi:hypothetical protein